MKHPKHIGHLFIFVFLSSTPSLCRSPVTRPRDRCTGEEKGNRMVKISAEIHGCSHENMHPSATNPSEGCIDCTVELASRPCWQYGVDVKTCNLDTRRHGRVLLQEEVRDGSRSLAVPDMEGEYSWVAEVNVHHVRAISKTGQEEKGQHKYSSTPGIRTHDPSIESPTLCHSALPVPLEGADVKSSVNETVQQQLHEQTERERATQHGTSKPDPVVLSLFTTITSKCQVSLTISCHGDDIVTGELTSFTDAFTKSRTDFFNCYTVTPSRSREPEENHLRCKMLLFKTSNLACPGVCPLEKELDILLPRDFPFQCDLHRCLSCSEALSRKHRRISTCVIHRDTGKCTHNRTIRRTDHTAIERSTSTSGDVLDLQTLPFPKLTSQTCISQKTRTIWTLLVACVCHRFVDVLIIVTVVLRLILRRNRVKSIGNKDVTHSFSFNDVDDRKANRRNFFHTPKSDSDIFNTVLSWPWKERVGYVSKLAGQWSVVVRPLTRFLPDTTNNPDLDLAHVGYRLATLSALPPSVPVSRVQLADAGFYYRGQGDEMICYSCHTRYSGWTSQDRPMEVHRRISPDCPHVVERDRPLSATTETTSVPAAPSGVQQQLGRQGNSSSEISNTQVIESSLRESHIEDGENTQTGASVVTNPSDTARRVHGAAAGSYAGRPTSSSGTQETTPPVSSSSSLTPSRPAASSSSACGDQGTAPRRLGLLGGALDAADGRAQGSGEGAATRQMFPRAGLDLGGAVYPMYQDMASRRRSFPHWDDRRAPPLDQMILCGMFYAGYADCVRCFYCGVGLKHWEVTDDVWVEHVRWRPSCGYLRSVKGDNYITRTLARLGREAGGEADDDGGPGDGQDRRDGDIRPGNSRAASAGRPGRQQDREQQLRRAPPARPQANVTSSSSSSSGANPTSGSSTSTARTAAGTGRTSSTGTTSSAASPATSAASSPTSCNSQSGARPEGGASTSAARSEESQSQRVARLQAENRELARRLRCKVCVTEPIDTILMPCGHLVVCETCARNVTQCPLCHDRIRATAKVHMN